MAEHKTSRVREKKATRGREALCPSLVVSLCDQGHCFQMWLEAPAAAAADDYHSASPLDASVDPLPRPLRVTDDGGARPVSPALHFHPTVPERRFEGDVTGSYPMEHWRRGHLERDMSVMMAELG